MNDQLLHDKPFGTQQRVTVRCTYEDGDSIITDFNGSYDDAEEYFLGNTFNIGSVKDNLQKCVVVEDLTDLNEKGINYGRE